MTNDERRSPNFLFYLLLALLISLNASLGFAASPSLVRTKQLDSSKWTLYFTAGVEMDVEAYKQLHQVFDHQVEILAVMLVNKRDEITRMVSPPSKFIFPLLIEKDPFLEINTQNKRLINYWQNSKYGVEEKEAYTIRFIQNCIQNPLGSLSVIAKNGDLFVKAVLFDDQIIFPIGFIKQPIQNLFSKIELNQFFNSFKWQNWNSQELKQKIHSELKKFPKKSLQIKKEWFCLSTETSSQMTDEFIRWLSIQRAQEPELAYSFIVHSHPFPQQWMATLPYAKNLPDWARAVEFVLLPSGQDIRGNVEGIIPFSGIYTFASQTNQIAWSFYPINEDFFELARQLNQIMIRLWDRPLHSEESLAGKKIVKKMASQQAQIIPLKNARELQQLLQHSDQILKDRQNRQKHYLRLLSKRIEKLLPKWTQSLKEALSLTHNFSRLSKALNTWELFLSLHPFPDDLTGSMFYISNQMTLKLLKEKNKVGANLSSSFQIDEDLLLELEEKLNSQNRFDSQSKYLNQFLEVLFKYIL